MRLILDTQMNSEFVQDTFNVKSVFPSLPSQFCNKYWIVEYFWSIYCSDLKFIRIFTVVSYYLKVKVNKTFFKSEFLIEI